MTRSFGATTRCIIDRFRRTLRTDVAFLVLIPGAVPASPVVTGQLTYRLSWNGIPAASASVNVTRLETQGAQQYYVEATARTGWLVDLLWSLRAYVSSSFTADNLAPLGFRYDREENKRHSVTEIVFDARTQEAIGTRRRGNETSVVDVHDGTVVDPVTAIFQALNQPLDAGRTLSYEVFTGESRYRIELYILREESVTVAAGTFPAWRVEPHIWRVGSGPDQRVRRITLWVSQAPVRALLRIRSEVFIGSVDCDLLRVSPSS